MGFFDLFKKKYQTISAAEAVQAQTDGAILIDVRESHEYRSGHAPGAKNLSVQLIERRLGEIPNPKRATDYCGLPIWHAQPAGC